MGSCIPRGIPPSIRRPDAPSATTTAAIPAARTCTTRAARSRFGYANEQLAAFDPANPRNEDHVGHKIEWENDVELTAGGGQFQIRCDVLTKLHQGTHSKDAFTNNLHELVYHLSCGDGTKFHVVLMTAIGKPGEFRRSCDHGVAIQAGTATPANSPEGGGFRAIPDRFCIEQEVLVPQRAELELLRPERDLGDVQQHPAGGRPHPGVLQPVLPGAPGEPVLQPGARAGSRSPGRHLLRDRAQRRPRVRATTAKHRPRTARRRA